MLRQLMASSGHVSAATEFDRANMIVNIPD